ncbi:MAG: DUF4386 domain-containing protein [bacterium]
MTSTQKNARIAGLLYLLMGITGAFGLMYVPSKIIVAGNAAATANNIMTSESLFRIGIVSNLICQISFIFLVLALYRLLKGINKIHATLMLTLVVVSVPIAFLNTLNQLGALLVLSGDEYLKVFEPDKLNALMMVFLNLHGYGNNIVEIFWGLWLFPFGFLVFKSGFLPRILGILLIISCFSYLADSFTFLLIPHYHDIISEFASAPAALGECSIILWLLIKGVKVQQIN